MVTRVLRRIDDVCEASLDDTTLLLNIQRSRYHSLNPVGARIWELLSEPVDEAELVERLLREFEVTPDVCRTEVAAFLSALRDRGLIASP